MTALSVYIGIGSNLANPQHQVNQAISHLADLSQIQLLKCSSLYFSKPMGLIDQPDYVNAVVCVKTSLSAIDLLDLLQGIEAKQGRVRNGQHWGPRSLDLDILLYGEHVISTERLHVPHPGLHERAFVLYPLYEINPELIIPGQASLVELMESCPPEGLRKITT